MKGQRSLLLKGAAWVSASSIAINMLGFVSMIVLARLLLPEDFGLVAIAFAFAEILALVTEMSLAAAIVQRKSVDPKFFDTAWTMNALRGLLLGVLIAGSAPFVGAAYGDPRLTALIQVLAVANVISSLINPKFVLFQRDLDFSKTFIMQVANKVSAFCVTVGVAVVYQSYWALVLGTVAQSITTLVVSYALIAYRPRVSLAVWRELMSFSLWLTLGRWVEAMNWKATPLVFGFFVPTQFLGQFDVANRLVTKTVMQATLPFRALLFPAFSRLQDEPERLRGAYMRSQGTVCLIVMPMVAGIGLLATEFVVLLIGEKWLPAVPLVQLAALSRIIGLSQNVQALGMATANTKQLFIRNLISFTVRWPLVLGGLYLGRGDYSTMLIGAMIGQVITSVINNLINVHLVSQISTISFKDHAAFVWRPLIGLIAIAGTVLTVQEFLPNAQDTVQLLINVAVASVVGGVAYLGSLLVIWNIMGRGQTLEKELVTISRNLIAKAISKGRAA